MKKFLIRIALFLIPFVALALVYIIIDPFYVLRLHGKCERMGLYPQNRESVCLQVYRLGQANGRGHNSFIMGNSRSMLCNAEDWQRHLGPDAVVMHFDAYAETVQGVYQKLAYIDRSGGRIDNLLWITDHDSFDTPNPRIKHLYLRAPLLDSSVHWFDYQFTFAAVFFDIRFLVAYTDMLMFGQKRSYMHEYLDLADQTFDPRTAQVYMYGYEELIARSPEKYYDAAKMKVFYRRDTIQRSAPRVIFKEQMQYLIGIMDILGKHQTDYRIILNPTYDQKRFDRQDLAALVSVFAEERIFDFSGRNAITEDYRNYYEASHYRPQVARFMIDSIYCAKNIVCR